MSEEIKDAREVAPDLTASLVKRTTPGFGPGYVNMAIPDRGHMPSCVAHEFVSADTYNAFCADHPDWLTVFLGVRGDKVFVLFQVLKTEFGVEEMQMASRYAEEKMAEFRQKRKEQEEAEAKAKREKEEADVELTRAGRFCAEAHGAFIKDLPGISKIKSIRTSIADDILKYVESNNVDTKALTKILSKYVKEGAK